MKIVTSNALSEGQTQAVRVLEQCVLQAEGLQNTAFLDNTLNFDREAPCFYLGWEGNTLAAFLTVFFPDREDGEITAFTHPEFRQKGWFSALYREAADDLRALGVSRAVFAAEADSQSARKTLPHFQGLAFERSEYRMACRKARAALLKKGLRVTPLSLKNREAYFDISIPPDLPGSDGKVSKGVSPEKEARIDAILNSKTRQGFLLYRQGNPVGVFDLEMGGNRVLLYGVAVKKGERNQGYGREIVQYALREGERLQKPVVLDVDAENAPALHLYRSCGFEICFRIDYYACPL